MLVVEGDFAGVDRMDGSGDVIVEPLLLGGVDELGATGFDDGPQGEAADGVAQAVAEGKLHARVKVVVGEVGGGFRQNVEGDSLPGAEHQTSEGEEGHFAERGAGVDGRVVLEE